LRFKALCVVDVVGTLFSGVVAIVLAYRGFGVWSLAVRIVLGSALRTLGVGLFAGWRPGLVVRCQSAKPLLAFGLPLLGFAILNYFNRQFDNLLIGRVLGAEALGYYTMAYAVMLLPLGHVSHTICSVAYPIFSSLRGQKSRVAGYYLRVLKTIALIVFPLMMGTSLLAHVAVPWLLGERWRPAVLPVQLLAALATVQALYTTVGIVFRSQGRTGLELRTFLFVTPAVVGSFLVGIRWGLVGVCLCYSACMLVVTPVVLGVVLKLVGARLRDAVRAVGPAALCSGVMAALLVALQWTRPFLPALSRDSVFLGLSVATGGSVYVAALLVGFPAEVHTLWALARKAVGPANA
jgi:PST family polysaccharide transporter